MGKGWKILVPFLEAKKVLLGSEDFFGGGYFWRGLTMILIS
jgi:hypothetical protein